LEPGKKTHGKEDDISVRDTGEKKSIGKARGEPEGGSKKKKNSHSLTFWGSAAGPARKKKKWPGTKKGREEVPGKGGWVNDQRCA